jgi:hypothetical protein
MLVVGSASTLLSLSMTLSDASDPTFLLATSSFLPSSPPFLALKPHLWQTRTSLPSFGLKRVSHSGQNLNTQATPLSLATF